MNITISPCKLSGTVAAIPSKSVAHRALICAALAAIQGGGKFEPPPEMLGLCRDIDATIDCLKSLGNGKPGLLGKTLHCGESGSLLRFLLPIVGALGCGAEMRMEGRLPERPLTPLYEELVKNGLTLSPQGSNPLKVKGKLHGGHFFIDAGISSQFISGLLFALPLLDAPEASSIRLYGKTESAAYVDMTLQMLARFGIKVHYDEACFIIPPKQTYVLPENVSALNEGDWSNAAFWLAAGVLVTGLNDESAQGDRAIVHILDSFMNTSDKVEEIAVDAADIPDLVPILAVAATRYNRTTTIFNAERLRLKESDRLAAITAMLNAMGADVSENEDGLTIHGGSPLKGGCNVSACNDHRIAMAAAIAATMCENAVTIKDADCVDKSYPTFWEDFRSLGGLAEVEA